jgi:hypothetical protein
MMVILLGSLLMRKINGCPKAVSIGTQPLSLLMEEKMTNKVIPITRTMGSFNKNLESFIPNCRDDAKKFENFH